MSVAPTSRRHDPHHPRFSGRNATHRNLRKTSNHVFCSCLVSHMCITHTHEQYMCQSKAVQVIAASLCVALNTGEISSCAIEAGLTLAQGPCTRAPSTCACATPCLCCWPLPPSDRSPQPLWSALPVLERRPAKHTDGGLERAANPPQALAGSGTQRTASL